METKVCIKYVYSDVFIVYEVTLYKNIKYNVEELLNFSTYKFVKGL